jgi:hypothetical protein
MAIVQRIAALQKRHQWLDQMLVQEMRHFHPDESRVTQIKKSKLRVKDEIMNLEGVRQKIEFIADGEATYRRRASVH